jgi:glycosyltransferase involved in cell wall biosynthesis/tRNA A37 methylthiotransferase MiaB
MGGKRNVLLVTSAAPGQTPFSTSEKRPPIGIGFLISVLRDAGHNVFFIDNYLKPSNFLETDYLQRNDIDCVGIYANTICYRDTLRMLYRLDELRCSGKWSGQIIVGGPHATVAIDTIPSFVDHVVQGEGERAILDIVNRKVVERVLRYPCIRNLDELPMPAWDYFVRLPYKWGVDWFDEQPVFTMNTSRGCPFQCAFCSVGSIWGKQYSYFSAERIVKEIELLVERYQAKGIYFREDNFTLIRKRLITFCNLIIERGIKIFWACESRVDTLDAEIIQLMYRAGARAFYFGVESGSQRILNFLKKGITVDQIRRAFALCHKYGIKTAASIITGVPNETQEDLLQTEILLREIKPAVTWFNVFVGIPNSELYKFSISNKLYEFIDDRGLVYLRGHNERVKKFYGNAWDAMIPYSKTSPKISVIMSVYNGAEHLEDAIKSILKQTQPNFEFIIINDASTDSTSEILAKFDDPRIVIITNDENLGLTRSLNIGFKIAKGEYIARMDADDISHPLRFEKQVFFLDGHPDCLVVGTWTVVIGEDGRHLDLWKTEAEACRLEVSNPIVHGSAMIRKKILEKLGGYNEQFRYAQDYDLWIRISEYGRLCNLQEKLYYWRCHKKSISVSKKNDQLRFAAIARASALKRSVHSVNKGNPVVSVIVPTYNRPEMLFEAICSIQKQTYKNIEIIVVNDAGEDVSTVIDACQDSRIVYLHHSENRGLAAARNTGIRNAKGHYIALLDDDDVFFPHHLETALKALSSGWKVVYTDGVRAEYAKAIDRYELYRKHVPYSIDFDRSKLLIGNIAPVNCFVFERQAAFKAGLFDESYSVLEDWEFWLRLSALVPFHHIKQQTVQINWRTDGTTMTSSRQAEFKACRSRIYKRYQSEINQILNRDDIIKEFKAIWSQDNVSNFDCAHLQAVQTGTISIIILTYNQLRYTKECVESIQKHTPEPHEIIFLDNGSSDGSLKWLRKLIKRYSNYRLVENKTNLGFSKGCNQGIGAATGEYVLLLNNDVVVTENWLSGLLECFDRDDRIGIVGPMTNNISGPQKVPHVDYASVEDLHGYARAFRARNRYRRIPNRRIVGFCMLFKRRLIDEIGLLDESFGSGNFEDDDLCLRACLAGYRNLVAGDVFIHHYGSRTFIHNRIDYGTAMTANRKIFTQKWSRADVLREFGIRLRIQQAIEKSNEYKRKGNLEKSAASLLDAISQAPEERSLYISLAEMLIDNKRFRDALGILESMPMKEGDVRQLSLLGQIHEELGNFEKAHDYATQVLRVNPTDAIALNVIGILEYKKGEKDKAEKFFKKAIEANPSFGESFTNLGSLKWESGLRDEGIELFERGFILSPIVGDVLTAYHAAVSEMKYFDRAIPLFIDARALYPNDKRINFLLIAMLIQKEAYGSAMIEIENSMIQFGIDEGIISAGIEIRNKVGAIECSKGKKRACLSLCMIVKNEETNIANCLMSLKPVVDEIIVIDTGSTDKTKDIARVLGAKVYDYEWTEDFSEARNFSLSKATGDWILIMDADEVIASQDYAAFKKMISKLNNTKAYIMTTRNYTTAAGNRGWQENDGQYAAVEAGLGWIPSPKVRLFPNRRDIFFSNPVHELVEPSLKSLGLKIVLCPIPIHHYGKMDRANVVEKGKKYYELGIKKLENHKNNHRALTELGIQASELGEHEEAIRIWKRVLELKPNDGVAFMSLGSAHLMMCQYENALKYSFKALEIDPKLREAALNYAVAQMIIGDVRIAKEYLLKIIETDPNYPPAYARLSAVWLLEGCLEEGKACLERIQSKGYSRLYTIEKQVKELADVGNKEKAENLILSAKKIGIVSENLDNLLSACRIKTLPAVTCLQEESGARESVPIGL